MEHDSLATARVIGFNRKKELVAFYADHPEEEVKVKKIQKECVEQFKIKVSKIINSFTIKTFQTEFVKKERAEKEAARLEQIAQERRQYELMREEEQCKSIQNFKSNHVIEIDDTSESLNNSTILNQSIDIELILSENEELKKENAILKIKIGQYQVLVKRLKKIINKILTAHLHS